MLYIESFMNCIMCFYNELQFRSRISFFTAYIRHSTHRYSRTWIDTWYLKIHTFQAKQITTQYYTEYNDFT